MRHDDLVRDVRRALSAPRAVAEKLGLKVGQAGSSYVLVCCPVHAERTGSCSLHVRDGTLAVKCWGCDWTGDVLHLIAAVEQLDIARSFREVLARAAELAGMRDEAEAVRGGKPAPERQYGAMPAEPQFERDYPPAASIERFWDACTSASDDPGVSALLVSRRIDPDAVTRLDAARALAVETHWSDVPSWARFRGRREAAAPWTETGHRLILPVYDAAGAMRSVRAWLVTGEQGVPKRLPPAGFKTGALVAANYRAVAMLRGEDRPSRVVIVEGEPDTLARSTLSPDDAVIGIMSGSWNDGFSARVPFGCEVVVRTHLDPAGERYADEVIRSVAGRARVRRLQLQGVA